MLNVDIAYQPALLATEPTDHLTRAEQSLKAGNLREAESEIRICLGEDPRSGEAYNVLGEIRIAQQDLWGAEEFFSRATELSPELPEAYGNLSTLKLLRGKARDAGAAARRLLELSPTSYNAHFVLGTIAYEEGQYSQSWVNLYPLIHLPEVDDPLVLALAIEDSKRLGRDKEAKGFLSRLDSVPISRKDALLAAQIFRAPELQNYVLSWLQKTREGQDSSFEILYALGNAHWRAGQLKLAYQSYLDALSRKGSDVNVLLKLSSVCETLGEHQASMRYFYQAQFAPKEDVATLITYSLACMKWHLFFDARETLEQAVTLGSQGEYAHYLLAATLYGLSDYPRADVELRKVLTLRANDVDARMLLGMVLMTSGRSDDAQEQFRLVLKMDPSRGDAHYYLAQVYRRRGARSEYEKELAEAMRLDPKDARPFADMAGLDISEGRLELAKIRLEEALRLDPTSARGHYHRGVLLRKMGQPEEAKGEFSLAERLRVQEEKNAVTLLLFKDTEEYNQALQLEH
jgi:tetratricopeptide (TPR) repeat protein